MPLLRTDLERALDELILQEEGIRFQRLAVVLGKQRWRELIACQPKKDLGLDAYAPASLTPEKICKGLAASITPSLGKVSADAKRARENYPDLKALLFVTAGKVVNATQQKWKEKIQKDHGLELHVIEREEIISALTMPENASLCAFHLGLDIDSEPPLADCIASIRRAAAAVTQAWARKTKGHPLIDLTAVKLGPAGAESAAVLSLQQLDDELSRSRRVILEGPAGRGKTTTLTQLARRARAAGTCFMVDLPRWTSSRQPMLEFIAGMPQFQAEGVTANDLAGVQRTEPFLFLLNGWNEIGESNSRQAACALQELERDFPSAGIIVATRTHHLKPPLPGALRLRLRHLARSQRSAYLEARLGAKGTELIARIESDPSLEELTRTPFILSEVASLFEAGLSVPSTKIGILAQVVRLQEQREEHTNALAGAPIYGRQTDYLTDLANKMTSSGSVELPEARARAIVADLSTELANSGQIEPAGAPTVLATLTAHHLLERVDYPQPAYRFDHQQLQEYFSALALRRQLLDLRDDESNAIGRFTADYVNQPVWGEPLRMIAVSLAEESGDAGADRRNARAGAKLVQMALAVDFVFAGELARLCGATVWDEVGTVVGDRFRAVYAMRDGNFQHYAVAAMLATGMGDFSDIVVPLLSGKDQQSRLRTYRLWPDIRVTSLGPNWGDELRGWSGAAQADFVSESLRHRIDSEVVAFAVETRSVAVKVAGVTGLIWHKADDALTRVLTSMDAQTFEHVVRENAGLLPSAFRSQSITALREALETSADQTARLRTALRLVALGETDLDDVIKEAMAALPSHELGDSCWILIQPALKHLRNTDPAWASEWVAIQIAEGVLYGHEHWMPFATTIPDHVVEECLKRLETEELEYRHLEGTTAVVAAGADANLAARVFAGLRRMSREVDANPDQQHEFERLVIRQLEALFRRFPDDVAGAGVISSVEDGNALDIKVAARLLGRAGMVDKQRLYIVNADLKARLRGYLRDSIDLVLRQDDFTGVEKAHSASAISQVGEPEDMADLVTLIRADIERVGRGRAERVAGERGSRANGASTSYASWHVAALIRLDPVGADQVLIDLLPEPEYARVVAEAMARDFVPKPERIAHTRFRHDLMWAAREGRELQPDDNQRRRRFGAALRSEIARLGAWPEDGMSVANRKELARALAAIDGRGSAEVVLEVIAMPGEWDEYTRLDAAERLLMAGVVIPAASAFALADSILERTENWTQDSDRYLLRRIVALCPLVDDPVAGIAKVRDMLGKQPLRGHELREVVTALGESRSDAAADLLQEFGSDEPMSEQLDADLVKAIATLDTPSTRDMLLGFVDPDIGGFALTRGFCREEGLIEALTELAQRRTEVVGKLRELCHLNLPERNRAVLSRVMASLGTPEAYAANLNLLNDTNPSPVPRGIWDQLETEFVERRPSAQNPNAFTLHGRTSNTLRAQLFRMALHDLKRRESAFKLLAAIEVWRLEHGRPAGEPLHPDLASRESWPPEEP